MSFLRRIKRSLHRRCVDYFSLVGETINRAKNFTARQDAFTTVNLTGKGTDNDGIIRLAVVSRSCILQQNTNTFLVGHFFFVSWPVSHNSSPSVSVTAIFFPRNFCSFVLKAISNATKSPICKS